MKSLVTIVAFVALCSCVNWREHMPAWPSDEVSFKAACETDHDPVTGSTTYRSPGGWAYNIDIGKDKFETDLHLLRTWPGQPVQLYVSSTRKGWRSFSRAYCDGKALKFVSIDREVTERAECVETFAATISRKQMQLADGGLTVGFRGTRGKMDVFVPGHVCRAFIAYVLEQEVAAGGRE